jgi:hypothetical protein
LGIWCFFCYQYSTFTVHIYSDAHGKFHIKNTPQNAVLFIRRSCAAVDFSSVLFKVGRQQKNNKAHTSPTLPSIEEYK